MDKEQKDGVTLSKKSIIIAAIIVLILLIGGIILGANWNKWFGKKEASTNQNQSDLVKKPSIELDENASEYTGEKPKDQGGEAVGIKIPGYPSITIVKDSKDVTMALMNPEGNPCYFKFELVLKDSGETIFESKYVKPGDCIYDVHLNKPLAEGEYPATIKITTISLDGETPLNGANVETILIAK